MTTSRGPYVERQKRLLIATNKQARFLVAVGECGEKPRTRQLRLRLDFNKPSLDLGWLGLAPGNLPVPYLQELSRWSYPTKWRYTTLYSSTVLCTVPCGMIAFLCKLGSRRQVEFCMSVDERFDSESQ